MLASTIRSTRGLIVLKALSTCNDQVRKFEPSFGRSTGSNSIGVDILSHGGEALDENLSLIPIERT